MERSIDKDPIGFYKSRGDPSTGFSLKLTQGLKCLPMKSNLNSYPPVTLRKPYDLTATSIYLVKLVFMSALLVIMGCEAQVGDPCVSSTQCAPGQLCDVNSDEGYCTQRDCEEGSCPSGSVCVTFENLDRYCMATCASGDGCRDGYLCDEEIASEPICRQAP